MAGFQTLPAPRVDPYAGDNARAVMSMMQILGQGEVARRRKFMTENVLKALAAGGGTEGVSSAALTKPGYSSGISGMLQRFASLFADRAGGIDDIIAGQGIKNAMMDPLKRQSMQANLDFTKARTKYYSTPRPVSATQKISQRKIKMIEAAEAAGDQEKVERLMGIRTEGTEKTLDEQIKSWQALQNAAAGQYYAPGLEGGATAPKNQKVYDLATRMLDGLLGDGTPGTKTPAAVPSQSNVVPITATNPQTGEKIISNDSGVTWQKAP